MSAPPNGSGQSSAGHFTRFQLDWRERIEARLGKADIRFSTRQVAGDGQTYLIVKVPATAHQVIDIYVYGDEVALVLAERWSFQETDEAAVQEERLARFVEVLRARTLPADN